jgi:hypothetical protein
LNYQIANHHCQKFTIHEDLPGKGFYLFIYNLKIFCRHDYLQDAEEAIKKFAFNEFGGPIDS